jgi:hypothetical protein
MQQLKIVTLWLVWLLTEMDTDDLIRKTLKSVKNIKGQWPCWCTVLIIVSLYLIIYLNLLKILVWPETEKLMLKMNFYLLCTFIEHILFYKRFGQLFSIDIETHSYILTTEFISYIFSSFMCPCSCEYNWNVLVMSHFNSNITNIRMSLNINWK